MEMLFWLLICLFKKVEGGVSRKEVFVEMVVFVYVCVYDWYGKDCLVFF